MKRLVLSISVLVTAASVLAASGQETPPPALDPAPPPQRVAMHALATPPPAESPLVRAARMSSRSKKKSSVITNDTLLKSGGHITTAKTQWPLPRVIPAEMTPEEARAIEKHNREVREATAARAKKAEAGRKLQKERTAAIYNGDDAEGMLEDPALAEGKMRPQPKADAPPPPRPPLN